MRTVDEFRSAIRDSKRVGLITGPLGESDAVTRWLRYAAGHDGVELLGSPPISAGLYDRVIDLRVANRDFLEAWFAELYPGVAIARELAPAARLIDEAIDAGVESIDDERLTGSAGYAEIEADLHAVGGPRFFDFARVLALVYPRSIQVGDEWVQLVNRLGGGTWSIADLGIVLRDCSDVLALVHDSNDSDSASFASPFVAKVVAARVKTSTSEHYSMFRALREMAVSSLMRNDAGDRFVATELPLQALAGEAVEELCDDGMALLAADPRCLIDVIEHPSSRVSTGSKLVLRAAHRLGQNDTLSQLELAARRSAMIRLADQIASGSPARQWDPVWATSQPVNTNRILLAKSANVLCVARHPLDSDSLSYAGLSNGTVWELSPHREARLLWRQTPGLSEIRGMAAVAVDGGVLVVTGHSDQGIRAIDAGSGSERWSDVVTMEGPLSTVAAGDGVVVAGGVDGILAVIDAATGEHLLKSVKLGVEIRGITILSTVIVTCLVDGFVAGIDRTSGEVLWKVPVPGTGEVCNSLAAIETATGLQVAVGTSSGALYEGESSDARQEPVLRETHQFWSSANSLVLQVTDDGVDLIAALSDASWARRRAGTDDWNRYFGHVGAINSLIVSDDGRVITGSGEGTVRSWIPRLIKSEAVTLEWGVRHRGPVTGINIDLAASRGDITHVTGGADGTIRVWIGASDTTGTRIAEHDSPVRALVWDATSETVYVGHADGVLRTVTRRERGWEAQLVGIQHDGVRGLALSPAGRLYSTGVDGTVTRWHADLSTGGAVTKQVSGFGYTAAIGWLDGTIAVGGQDGRVQLLNPVTLENLKDVDLGSSVVSLVGRDRDLFAGLASGEVVVLLDFERQATAPMRRLPIHKGEVRGIQAFELGGNLVIATTGLDRRLVISDLRSPEPLADIAQDGFGMGLHADPPYIAVSTTSGAMVIRLSTELPGFLGSPRALRPVSDHVSVS